MSSHGTREAVNPAGDGHQGRRLYVLRRSRRGERVIRVRLRAAKRTVPRPSPTSTRCSATRRQEADALLRRGAAEASRTTTRGVSSARRWPACSGPSSSTTTTSRSGSRATRPAPAAARSASTAATSDWRHLYNADIIVDARQVGVSRGSRPGIWPSTASPLALIDPDFAKNQLILLLREWYMHPNGQIPAYEWNFGDVNPPVHAWAALARLSDRAVAEAARATAPSWSASSTS